MPSPEPRPQPPGEQDCCHGDCAPNCVFDVYERELERWQACQDAATDQDERKER